MTSSIAAVVEALQASLHALPELQVVVKRALPNGEKWIADHCCAKVYIRADLSDAEGVRALLSGLDALLEGHIQNGWRSATVPPQRTTSPDLELRHTRRC